MEIVNIEARTFEAMLSKFEVFADRMEKLLDGAEMLLEASGDDSRVRIYGVVDEEEGKISDFILHTPSDCTIICILGKISTDALAKLALNE